VSSHGTTAARAAAEAIRDRLPSESPVLAVILGSGLGGLARQIDDAIVLPFADVSGFPGATVVGHQGALIAGGLEGKPILALAGRFHMYEGHDATLAAYPTRVLAALGAPALFVSNAAGGVRRTFVPGDLMLIRDHVNLMFRNPLVGSQEPCDVRFPDMSEPYDPTLQQRVRDVARDQGLALQEGVYAGLLGPSYETPAEVRMLERIGVDAVGMSTVPEVIVARAMGMRVVGVSCITNLACGLTTTPITHDEVLETTAVAADRFEHLVRGFVRAL
jgi:purine-nucleoside phosphorylase